MAFLMLLHEKMRLQRKVNKLTYKQLRASNRKERITKNIERVQKYYSKKHDTLQKQAQLMQSQATVFFQNMMGVGAQNQMFNPFCYQNGNAGMTTAVAQVMSGWAQDVSAHPDKYKYKYNEDGTQKEGQLTGERAAQLWNAYLNGQIAPEVVDQKQTGFYLINGDSSNKVNPQEWAALQSAMTQANGQVQQRQQAAGQMSSQYQNNVSIWLSAQEAQLEAEQDEALLPLQAEETDMDLEKESCEAQLADAKARLESIKQACSEGIKDSAPTFGLG